MITKIFGSPQGDFGLKLPSIPKQPKQHFKILSFINKNLLQIICIFKIFGWIKNVTKCTYLIN